MKLSALPKWLKWTLIFGSLALVIFMINKHLTKRQQDAAALTASVESKKKTAHIELAVGDIAIAERMALSKGLPISGTLKAVNSALVKARVMGELRGLTVREGDNVQAGQLLATIDTTEYAARLEQAQKTAEAARSQVEIAQRGFDNNKALVDQNFISKTALEASLATLNGAKANYAAALAGVDIVKKTLDDTRVVAPIRGTIAMRAARPGERVNVESPIVEIVDLSRLELEAALTPSDSLAVRVGQTARLTFEGSNTPVAARVIRISPSATPGARSVVVYLALDQTTGLRHGLFAQGALDTGKVEELSVPFTAVHHDKPAPYVQVVEDGKVAHKTVTLGTRGAFNGLEYVAVQGINAGAVVLQGTVGVIREGTVASTQPAKDANANTNPTSLKPNMLPLTIPNKTKVN